MSCVIGIRSDEDGKTEEKRVALWRKCNQPLINSANGKECCG